MSKQLNYILKIIFIALIIIWSTFVLIDYSRAKKGTPPIICLNETRENSSSGTYYECTSFGYKYYEFEKSDGTKDYGFSTIFVKNPIKERLNENP